MNNPALKITAKSPSACSNVELGAFIAFVRAGGEVVVHGLADRIQSAAILVFAYIDGALVGVAALKKPQPSYRRSVSEKSGVPLSAENFPFELGWVYVSPNVRNQGLSLQLSQAVIEASGGAGVLATSRTDNEHMHSTLAKLGFESTGKTYSSGHGKHSLQLFIRCAAQPVVQAGRKSAQPLSSTLELYADHAHETIVICFHIEPIFYFSFRL
jgi:predicted GNAT family N-acyltransferase